MNEESSIDWGPIYDFVVNPFIIYIINLNPQRIAIPYDKYKIISLINSSIKVNVSFHIRSLASGGSSISIPGGKFIIFFRNILIKLLNHKY
jgi:hypothetical protein